MGASRIQSTSLAGNRMPRYCLPLTSALCPPRSLLVAAQTLREGRHAAIPSPAMLPSPRPRQSTARSLKRLRTPSRSTNPSPNLPRTLCSRFLHLLLGQSRQTSRRSQPLPPNSQPDNPQPLPNSLPGNRWAFLSTLPQAHLHQPLWPGHSLLLQPARLHPPRCRHRPPPQRHPCQPLTGPPRWRSLGRSPATKRLPLRRLTGQVLDLEFNGAVVLARSQSKSRFVSFLSPFCSILTSSRSLLLLDRKLPLLRSTHAINRKLGTPLLVLRRIEALNKQSAGLWLPTRTTR